MNLRLALVTTVATMTFVPSAQAATFPPANSGCGPDGPTRSETLPTASLASSTLRLRDTGRGGVLVRGNQYASAIVSFRQTGGRRVGGTPSGGYTCTTSGQSTVSVPLNSYGRAIMRRHGSLRVQVRLFLTNGSGVINTVRLNGTIRRG